ncbi:MAG TPA: hypothetical protein ENG16_05720, partial [Archaeoglobus sp.]|nr:hypothetical protein [Archaeoglobus sp.]
MLFAKRIFKNCFLTTPLFKTKQTEKISKRSMKNNMSKKIFPFLLIIFLIVLSSLLFNFRNSQRIEIKAQSLGRSTWTKSCGAATASCSCINTPPCSAEGPCDEGTRSSSCSYTCPAPPANASVSNTCTYTQNVTDDCTSTGGTCIFIPIGDGFYTCATSCSISCSYSSGECKYTCDSGWVDCDLDESNGCECNIAAGFSCIDNTCLAPTEEIRYMRSNWVTVNGLMARELGETLIGSSTSSSIISQSSGNASYRNYLSIRVWKRTAGGAETEITSTYSAVASSWGTEELSATWDCPETNLNLTDSIVVEVYGRPYNGSWSLLATFTTEQLGVTQLNAATWAVHYHLVRTYSSSANMTYYHFYWGSLSYNSRIENFSIPNRVPKINSVSDSPDPQKGGSDITFTSSASDPDGDNIKLYICKDSSCSNCNPGDTSNCWAVTTNWVATNPSASYTCPSCTAITNNYWARACDEKNGCSEIITSDDSSFTCKKENGCAETDPNNCFSGYAVDGVCCNEDCTGTCEYCGGYDGTPAGTCAIRNAGDNVECAECWECDGTNPNCVALTCPGEEICISNECVIPNLYGFAWSQNIGWISFNYKNCDPDADGWTEGGVNNPDYPQCPDGLQIEPYGVHVFGLPSDTTRDIKGYAWSPNIGWIKFDPPSPYPWGHYNHFTQYQAGTVYGWARACGAAPDPLSCGGGTGGNAESGNWEGWINMTDLSGNDWHEVSFTDPDHDILLDFGDEMQGWAWGGGGADKN